MSIKTNISSVVARQVGGLQGKLTAQVQGRVLEVLGKFSNKCPDPTEIQNIIKTKNTLLRHINSFQSRLARYNSLASKLDRSITTVKRVITVLKAIPIPTAIIPPSTGGVGIPIKVLNTYSDALVRLNKILDRLEDDKAAILSITGSVGGTVTNLQNRLKAIDAAILECSKESPNLADIIKTSQPRENTGSEGIPNEDYLYKGFILKIVQDPNSPKIAPLRFATATDRRGIVVLKGPSSFSSSTKVLLDEIKFRIDNQLP